MNAQRPRTWPARVVLGTVLGALVAVLALVGYQPAGRPADASFQPQPTSIAFVPLYPEQPAQAQRLGGAVEPDFANSRAANMAALYAEPTVEIVDTDPPVPPAPAVSSDAALDESCAFPCVPEVFLEATDKDEIPAEADGEAPEGPADVESSEENPETE